MPFAIHDRIVTRANLETYREVRATRLEPIRHLLIVGTITRIAADGLSCYVHFEGTEEGEETFFAIEEIDREPTDLS
jgi:hypothetical protein